jgi:hypothetical protein
MIALVSAALQDKTQNIVKMPEMGQPAPKFCFVGNVEIRPVNLKAPNIKKEFKRFDAQFESALVVNNMANKNIPEAKKAANWFLLLPPEGQEVLYDATAEIRASREKMEETLTKHYTIQGSKRLVRHELSKISQEEGQTFRAFYKRLKDKIGLYNYADRDDLIIGAIIRGVQEDLRLDLLKFKADTPLTEYVKAAEKFEVNIARIQAMTSSGPSPRVNVTFTTRTPGGSYQRTLVCRSGCSPSSPKPSTSGYRPDRCSRNSHYKGKPDFKWRHGHPKSEAYHPRCINCGKRHRPGTPNCSAYGHICARCTRPDHFEAMCKHRPMLNKTDKIKPHGGSFAGKRVGDKNDVIGQHNVIYLQGSDESTGVDKTLRPTKRYKPLFSEKGHVDMDTHHGQNSERSRKHHCEPGRKHSTNRKTEKFKCHGHPTSRKQGNGNYDKIKTDNTTGAEVSDESSADEETVHATKCYKTSHSRECKVGVHWQ